MMGTLVEAYFVYNILASNFSGGPVTVQIYRPLGPIATHT